jgi:RNA polymerase sigma-70 factor (ECF subfamily)
MTTPADDATLLAAIARHDAAAWESLIARYQGRLLAFARSRLHDHAAAEDVVQETFLGFLTALPNYDHRGSLEAFLFTIASHRLTDALRRRGIRPRLMSSLSRDAEADTGPEPVSPQRKVSSLARSQERRQIADRVLGDSLAGLIQTWVSRAEFERLKCAELLLGLGWPNKQIALRLGISEQTVANHKAFIVQKLKHAASAAHLHDEEWDADDR